MDIYYTFKKFWELENVQSSTKLEPEDEQVEMHFLATHSRNENAKYVLELPFSTDNSDLGGTQTGATTKTRVAAVDVCGSSSIWGLRCHHRKSLLGISSFFPSAQC